MTGTPDKPKRRWPPDLSDLRLICATCPNAKMVAFEDAAKSFGVSVLTLGRWIAEHCKELDAHEMVRDEPSPAVAEVESVEMYIVPKDPAEVAAAAIILEESPKADG
ncbi:MAG TPA: hypothetical protein VNA25_14225 [Phycisphaerae bacterium]|nr:hypothetical protein [Phycisphaerae bacterium]